MNDLLTIVVVAIGLSFDSFAASLGCGIGNSNISFSKAFKVGSVLALFQGGMPIIGYLLGSSFSAYIEAFDHWIAFILLFLLGARMIKGGLTQDDDSSGGIDVNRFSTLVAMGFGTSIDALVVGVSISFIGGRIWLSSVMIGIITLLASMTAIRIGKSAAGKAGSLAEIAGGSILILLGAKILIEHLAF